MLFYKKDQNPGKTSQAGIFLLSMPSAGQGLF